MKANPILNQRSKLRGLRKIQILLVSLTSLIFTTMETPALVYGNVKSTNVDLFAVIVESATTASNFCTCHLHVTYYKHIMIKLIQYMIMVNLK